MKCEFLEFLVVRNKAWTVYVTVAFVIVSVCGGVVGGWGRLTDLAMKGPEIASHHGGSGHKRS